MVKCRYGCSLRCIVFFCQFANGLVELYPELFDSEGVASQHQVNFGKKWKGYTAIIELAEGDILKIDEIVKQPLEKCLLYLAYKSDKNQLDSLLHKEALKKIGQ